MTHNAYDQTAKVFLRHLKNFKKLLEKGADNAKARNFDTDVFFQSRIAPDMLPFPSQVRIATDIAKGCCARLTGAKPPIFEDNETTYELLIDRIQKCHDYIVGFKPSDFDGAETREVTIPRRGGDLVRPGLDYYTNYVLPNFYFHITTAYNLLRKNGVNIGKMDFLGEL